MPPAWIGPTKCKQSVSGEAMQQCPIIPYKGRFIDGVGFCVTKNRCRTCKAEFRAAFDRVQIQTSKAV